MSNESFGRIYKSPNISYNSTTNHKVVDGTSNKGKKKFLLHKLLVAKVVLPSKENNQGLIKLFVE